MNQGGGGLIDMLGGSETNNSGPFEPPLSELFKAVKNLKKTKTNGPSKPPLENKSKKTAASKTWAELHLDSLDAEEGYYSTHTSLEDDCIPTQEDIDKHDEELRNFVENTQNIFSEEGDSTPIKNVVREYDELKIGMVWGNVFEVRTFIRNYAIINNFEYYQVKNENYRLRYKCGDEKCEWMCYVRRNCDGHTMELKSTSNLTHTCRGKAADKNKLAMQDGWPMKLNN
ncbi:hypothetical protein GIB67_029516 [Kingdonia uniflora]|uniref:Transposase MuDR plant domain-containing protein n=1 Tax=Kingdonia uniflora TaxID=39325 RepID=A0A7J7NYU5_9MAGN|nr:hypothetical protein GIB67_029516 [Kingdonia uniflora]